MGRLATRIRQRIYADRLTRQLYALYFLPWMTFTARYPIGRQIYDHEWDALIVLDACRVDAMREVAPEHDFIEDVGRVVSVGSTSKEWISNTFTDRYREEIAETACVSANSWVDTVLTDEVDWGFWTATKESFLQSHEVFGRLMARDTVTQADFETFESIGGLGAGESFGVTTAEDVTDYAIDVGRRSDADRLVVHYMQPHAPYIANVNDEGNIDEVDRKPFDALRAGADRKRIWNAYLDNLRYVLSNVERMLENLDAERVVITADHGEMFGEFGLYEHIGGIPHPALKTVPWVETSATDTHTYEPEIETRTDDVAVEDRLADLGYL
jgi:hypothetical protein